MKVLIFEPGKKAKVQEIGNSLEAMQAVVGGYIQAIYPWEDEVALVCNDEGKIAGLPLNRLIFDDEGNLVDVIAGTFFICSAPIESENFESLTEEQIIYYSGLM